MLTTLLAINSWFPWINFLTETMCFQLALVLILILFARANNLFYAFIYFFLFFFILGLLCCYFNLEFLAGFLWVIELTSWFIFILFYFFLNNTGQFFITNKNSFFILFYFFICTFLLFFYSFDSNLYFSLLNIIELWDNFFFFLAFNINNDIHGFFLSYYVLNNIFFFFFGFLILIASIISINILKLNKTTYYKTYFNFSKIFAFFNNFLNYDFTRKQNLFYQNLRKPVNYLITKKTNEWSKKEVN